MVFPLILTVRDPSFPPLHTHTHTHTHTPLQCLLTSAAISGQVDDSEVINFLLSTEIIPLCLRTMEMGSELSKTVATFIVQKILLDDVCTTMSAISCPVLSSPLPLMIFLPLLPPLVFSSSVHTLAPNSAPLTWACNSCD